MAELAFDVVEQILVRLQVKDLIRFKSMCKSWQSLISSPRFVKAHLNHAYKSDRDSHEFGHRRIRRKECGSFYGNETIIVGSCNGLVCVSPRDVEFVVANPSTREEKKLPAPPSQSFLPKYFKIRYIVGCLGFGYDSSTDDYKVIVGFWIAKGTLFHAFTLKSNTWKVIGQVKYRSILGVPGLLCGGALHWIMTHNNIKNMIISVDLSTEKLKEIHIPLGLLHESSFCNKLGFIEQCLCIYSYFSPSMKWVMKNNKWELYNIDHCENKHDIVHCLMESQTYIHDDGRRVPNNRDCVHHAIFVSSLVSPHLHANNSGLERNAKQGEEGNVSVESKEDAL